MKRILLILTILITITISLNMVFIPTCAVEIEDINYTIDYKTYISAQTEYFSEGEQYSHWVNSYHETIDENTTDFSNIRGLNEYKEKSLKYLSTDLHNTIVSTRRFMDGYVYPIPSGKAHLYLNFFNLPTDFNGEKVIEKEGVPFKVFGDGNGNFSFTVVSDFSGQKKKTIVVPPKVDITINEGIWLESYSVKYFNKQTGSLAFFKAESLEEVLAHCAETADLDKSIHISGEKHYSMRINANISYEMILELAYGNYKNTSNKPQQNQNNEQPPVQTPSVEESTTSQEQTTLNSEAPSSTVQNPSEQPTQSSQAQTQPEEIITKSPVKDTSNSTILPIIFSVCFILVLAVVFIVVLITIKRRKK